ncbi:hypothetical protein [Wenzhouxiangella marina]|uniref:Uncharacterized protein n=1 Tax=Wenzhouxiangella marina TaxID=1579979 RepID=A0A0K0XWR5_9GAMM|nr:hypothetical protein [Wenzhouxiangella marina]AKS42144.1 hypothetical protein WM2015_1777 [Wenzhouxiangella marina]MBB6086084.1 hypothetical protein [Wenzhouxiangella marina]
MPAPSAPRSSTPLVLLALTGSLLLHLALLAIHWTRGESPAADRTELAVRLDAPRASAPDSADQEIEPDPPAVEPEATPEIEPIIRPAEVSTEPGITIADAGDQAEDSSVRIEPRISSDQLLSAVRQNLAPTDIPEMAGPLEPAAVPELPSRRGWIDEYVGTVDARLERWQNNDGTRETRIVTASGQVICGRARAPTSFELFNPQFALNIMMFRECGRERPPPIDRNDPWVRAPRRDADDDRP